MFNRSGFNRTPFNRIAQPTIKASAILFGNGSLAAEANARDMSISAHLRGRGTLTAHSTLTKRSSALLSGQGGVSATAQITKTARGHLSGRGDLFGDLTLKKVMSARLSGRGDMHAIRMRRIMIFPPINRMSPTPVFIYDFDENLQLIIHPKNHTNIDNDGRIETPIIYNNARYVEELNGQETLEFDVLYKDNHDDVTWIEGDGRVVIRDIDGEFVEFVIRDVQDIHGANGPIKHVICESSEYELNDEWVTGYNAQDVTLRTAINAMLQGTRFEAGTIMDTDGTRVDLEPMSVKRSITELISIYGGEKRKRVEMTHNRITRRYLDILPRRGEHTGKRFVYGKDIQDIRREVDYTGIKTALYGFGQSTENDGPRVDFADVEWSEANGDPIDKPIGQRWVGDPEALYQYGYDGGTRHRFGVNESQLDDPGQLLMETWQQLQERNKPRFTYEMDVIVLEHVTGLDHERVRLGDTVYVIDRKVKPAIEVEATIIRIEHNLNDPSQSVVVLGNFRETFLGQFERVREVESIVDRKRGNWDAKETPGGAWEKAQQALAAAEQAIEDAKQDLEEAMIDIDEAMVIADDVFENKIQHPHNYQGYFEGDVGVTGELHVAGTIIGGSGATIQGTINAQNLNLLQANIVDANIQNANITGTLSGVDGTFVGNIITSQDAYVGDNLYVGGNTAGTNYKGIFFGSGGAGTPTISKYQNTQSLDVDLPSNGTFTVHGDIAVPGLNNSIQARSGWFNRIRSYNQSSGNLVYLGNTGDVSVETSAGNARWRANAWNYIMQNQSRTGLTAGRMQIYANGNSIAQFTFIDSYPHWGIRSGTAMVKFLQGSVAQIQFRDYSDNNYIDINAANVSTGSRREFKTDIENLKCSAIDGVMNTTVYSYCNKVGNKKGERTLGLMYDETPQEIRRGDDALSVNAQVTYLWKAMQELIREVRGGSNE